jgi:glyoxylase-like metal-dependent hydrolase (beta-lactamase superfamily II)
MKHPRIASLFALMLLYLPPGTPLTRADVRVIPGHGPVSSLEDVQAYLLMLKATRDAVANALKEGKTLEQMRQAKILNPWKKYSGDFISEDTFLETLYNSLTGQKNGRFIKHN